MKPISICFQCFGPYMDQQFIDFRELEKSGLFLICGETGSGKTTILDAMCYALYGKSSGGFRGKLLDMRCKRAGAGDKTFVEYIFSSGENTYRFYRAVVPKRQQKARAEAGKPLTYNEDYECQILKDGEFVPMSDTKAIQSYVDQKAEEILGLTYNQFKQVVILPQGQFEKLLTSNSDEKEEILVTLFHAEKWKKIADLISKQVSDEKKALELQKVALDQQLQQFGCQDLEQLQELSQNSFREAEELKKSVETLAQQLALTKTALDQAKEDDQGFCALEEAEKKLQQLLSRESAQKSKQQKLQQAEAAETVAPQYRVYREAKKRAEETAKDLTAREQKKTDAKQQLLKLQQEKKAHEEKRPEYENQVKQKILLESLQDLYLSLDDKKSALSQAKTGLRAAETAFQKASAAMETADLRFTHAVTEQREADEAYRRGQEIYIRDIGGVLAEQLTEGEKCPVCGSCHHPEPAKPSKDHITSEELERLTRTNDEALQRVSQATHAREQIAGEKQKAELSMTASRQAAETAEEIYRQALLQRAENIADEMQRQTAVQQLSSLIEQFQTADLSMQTRLNRAEGDLQSACQMAETAAETSAAAESALQDAKTDFLNALQKSDFANEDMYLSATMEPAVRQKLQADLIQYQTDLRSARQDRDEKQESLRGRVRPDVAEARKQLAAAENEKEQAGNAYVLKHKFWEDTENALKTLEKKLPELQEKQLKNRENVEFSQKLRGDSGISLQRYVLGVMLTSITAEANRLLKTVYGGRYQLYRTNEASGKAHKRGLELEVADQDGRRNVNSLSGGEKFLLSLSLGIGLAAVVQAKGNGIRLEAMFIDEGFGSLDSKSIDDAMEILESVRKSSGIVGIISHVDRLAETIPAKIEITKTRNGSRCKVRC